jgi:Voltage gated chloride channel/CBS domain
MAHGNSFNPINILIFLANWIFFTYVTSGTAVPCGIFLPCMLIGCALGHIYHPIHILLFPGHTIEMQMNSETISILGAAAVLSGATRMTYCLAVIMLETTSNVELFLPIIFTLFTSYGSGFILNSRSIYKGALRSKNIPVLNKSIPKCNRNLLTTKIMSAPPIFFHFLATVEQVFYQLQNTPFNGFPVTNSAGQPIGIIERDTLITLIQKHCWYTMPEEKQLNGSSQEDQSHSEVLHTAATVHVRHVKSMI